MTNKRKVILAHTNKPLTSGFTDVFYNWVFDFDHEDKQNQV